MVSLAAAWSVAILPFAALPARPARLELAPVPAFEAPTPIEPAVAEPAVPEPLAPTTRAYPAEMGGVALTPFLIEVVELTNAERERVGAPPLELNERLVQAADWMARDMSRNRYFGHVDLSGRRVNDRAYAFGYRGWKTIGENLAAGFDSPEAVVREWMASPSHRRNLLKPEHREIGVGYADAGARGYWVQTFGSRPGYIDPQWR